MVAVASKSDVSFRAMALADLETVLKNEQRAYTYPWTRGIFADCFSAGHDCRLIVCGEAIVGHAVLSAAAGEAHLLNICIQRDRQGQGLGREFALHMIGRARSLGAEQLFLEVRPSNRVAVALYESLGFVQIGTRKDYYPSAVGREDALVLGLTLLQAPHV